MTCHYPDLASFSDWLKQFFHAAPLIRSTTKILVLTCHQYRISKLDTQTSLHRVASGGTGVGKCCLFSKASQSKCLITSFIFWLLAYDVDKSNKPWRTTHWLLWLKIILILVKRFIQTKNVANICRIDFTLSQKFWVHWMKEMTPSDHAIDIS